MLDFTTRRLASLAAVIVAAAAALVLHAGCADEPAAFEKPLLIRALPGDAGLVIYDTGLRRFVVCDLDFRLLRIVRHPDFDKIWGFDVTRTGELAVLNRRAVASRDPSRPATFGAITDYDVDLFVFAADGSLARRFTWAASSDSVDVPGQLLALDDGAFLMTDIKQSRVLKISATGEVSRFLGGYGQKPGELFYPNDLVRLPDGRLVVIEAFNSRAQLFGADRAPLAMLAEKGTGEAQLMFPQFGCLDADGNLCITELYTMRISVFDPALRFLRAIDPHACGIADEIIQLYGIAATRKPARIYVCDAMNRAIHVFDAKGARVTTVRGFEPPRGDGK